jgi:hypothetical protein
LRWWDLEDNMIDSYDDWLILLKNIRLSKRLKDIFEGVCYVKWWLIRRERGVGDMNFCNKLYKFNDGMK